MGNQVQVDLLRYQLRKQEASAKAVPYISFILTHVALVLFLVLSFFINNLIGSANNSLVVKIVLAVVAVLFLASEWVYAIITSRRWKKDIQLLLQLEEEQRYREDQEKSRRQEELIAAEQFKNRVLEADLQRHRSQSGFQSQPQPIRSIRPPAASFPMNENNAQYPFPPMNGNNTQLPFPPMNPNIPRH